MWSSEKEYERSPKKWVEEGDSVIRLQLSERGKREQALGFMEVE